MSGLEPEDHDSVAGVFGVAHALACEVLYENDEGCGYWRKDETPEKRWERMRRWVESHIRS